MMDDCVFHKRRESAGLDADHGWREEIERAEDESARLDAELLRLREDREKAAHRLELALMTRRDAMIAVVKASPEYAALGRGP